MKFTKFNGIGVLGEQAVALGDLSGGYTVKIHEWPSIPIVDRSVSKSRSAGSEATRSDRRAEAGYAVLVRLQHGLPAGYNVAWRGRTASGTTARAGSSTCRRRWRAHARRDVVQLGPRPQIETIAGPFGFSGTSIRVMPLLARRATLKRFLDDYLNAPLETVGKLSVSSCGRGHRRGGRHGRAADAARSRTPCGYVYLTVTSFGDVTSGTNNVGDWADPSSPFCSP